MSDPSYIERPNRWLTAYALGFMTFLYVPILLIPLFSVNDSIYVKFPLEGFTLEWFVQLWHRDTIWNAFYNSLRVGVFASIITTTLGIFVAIAIARHRLSGQSAIIVFLMLPMIVPGIILGVALLIVLNQIGIQLSLLTVTIGHLIICLPFSVATLLPRFQGFDRSMEEASADLGETGFWTFWRVTFPIVFPGIVASLILTFLISFDEFFMAFFLGGSEATLPIYMWSQLRFPSEFPTILALATLILLFSYILVLLALWFGRIGLVKTIEDKPAGVA